MIDSRAEGRWPDPPMTLAPTLQSRQAEFRCAYRRAELRLRRFAATHGWSAFVERPFVDRLRVVEDGREFEEALRELCAVPEDFVVPRSYSGALEKGTLLAKTPERFAADYPEGMEDGAWEKLLCHEMAHRLHVRILEGDEEAMGPIWFFEGFALVAAEQFAADGAEGEEDVIRSVLETRTRGSYRRYAGVLRRLMETTALGDMVRAAREPSFGEELLGRLSPSSRLPRPA